MAGNLTFFISDLHLGANYLSNPRESECRVVRFLDSIKGEAKRVYLLGDVLDFWFEYSHVVPKGFVRFFGKLAELADSGVEIFWMLGNHDIWIFDYLPKELGINVIDGPVVHSIQGKQFFLSHGDNVGQQPWSYRFMRSVFRNRVCQFLFSWIHPCLTVPFAHGWSKQSRTSHKPVDEEADAMHGYTSLCDFTKQHAAAHHEISYYVFGHLHLAKEVTLESGQQMIVLGDWIKKFTYAVFDGNALSLRTFKE